MISTVCGRFDPWLCESNCRGTLNWLIVNITLQWQIQNYHPNEWIGFSCVNEKRQTYSTRTRVELDRLRDGLDWARSRQIVSLDIPPILRLRNTYRLFHNHASAKGMIGRGTILYRMKKHRWLMLLPPPTYRAPAMRIVLLIIGRMPVAANEVITGMMSMAHSWPTARKNIVGGGTWVKGQSSTVVVVFTYFSMCSDRQHVLNCAMHLSNVTCVPAVASS